MSNSKRKSTNENTNNEGKYTLLSYFSPVAKKSLNTSIGTAAGAGPAPGSISNSSTPTNTPLSICNNNNRNNSISNNKCSPKTPKATPTTANGKFILKNWFSKKKKKKTNIKYNVLIFKR